MPKINVHPVFHPTPVERSIFEDAIHQHLDTMNQPQAAKIHTPLFTSAHRIMQQKLSAQAATNRTGFAAIERNARATTSDEAFIILTGGVTTTSDASDSRRVTRSESEVQLHVLLESHFRAMNAMPSDGADSLDVNELEHQVSMHIALPGIVEQHGHICKPTALANIDQYYAGRYGVAPMPLRKNSKGEHQTATTGHAMSAYGKSIRELAKQHRSRQGEVLDADDYRKIATDMGYTVQTFSPTSIEGFKQRVLDCIKFGHLLTTCFAVDRATQRPTSNYDDNEHACVITGFDPVTNLLQLVHSGRRYDDIPVADLFASMQVLPATRTQEHYFKTNPLADDDQSPVKPIKYDKIQNHMAAHYPPDYLASIIPEPDTGFRNKLFLITPDLQHPRWHGE
ncbi:MAG: C39 family peptidase [Herminiimonas sp.]|nr:C39 family peptidase [Herminiimonas sp.]